MLFGLSEQIGKDTTERTDLADHATGNSGGDGPSQRNELEGSSVARSERGETEHEEQSCSEEGRRGHQPEESGYGDEEDNGECGDSPHTIGEPSTENTGERTSKGRENSEAACLNFRDVELGVEEGREEGGECCRSMEHQTRSCSLN